MEDILTVPGPWALTLLSLPYYIALQGTPYPIPGSLLKLPVFSVSVEVVIVDEVKGNTVFVIGPCRSHSFSKYSGSPWSLPGPASLRLRVQHGEGPQCRGARERRPCGRSSGAKELEPGAQGTGPEHRGSGSGTWAAEPFAHFPGKACAAQS